LKDFLNRFGALVVKLHTKDEDMTVHAFRQGVLSGPFNDSLIRCRQKMFNEIRHIVVAHIVAEEKVPKKDESISPVQPWGIGRPQPMRVHVVTTEKKAWGNNSHMKQGSLKPGHVRSKTPPPDTIFRWTSKS